MVTLYNHRGAFLSYLIAIFKRFVDRWRICFGKKWSKDFVNPVNYGAQLSLHNEKNRINF